MRIASTMLQYMELSVPKQQLSNLGEKFSIWTTSDIKTKMIS